MFPCAFFGYGLWWIFPIIMIAMMLLCFFMMRGCMGKMMCRPRSLSSSGSGEDASDQALYGEINKEEYIEKKKRP